MRLSLIKAIIVVSAGCFETDLRKFSNRFRFYGELRFVNKANRNRVWRVQPTILNKEKDRYSMSVITALKYQCFLVGTLSLSILFGCNRHAYEPSVDDTTTATRNQMWVATTGHIADALRKISAGTNVNIKTLCGPGVDPHSYNASTKDIQAITDADAVFFNGFHLEARLHHLLENEFGDKSWAMATAFPADARLDWVEDGQIDPEAPFDPHIWNHLPGWSECVEGLLTRVCEVNPDNAEMYKKNGQGYVDEILTVHQKAVEEFEPIARDQRVLVSAHDAFNYFANVYNFDSIAVLGIGNDAEADVKTIRDVAKTVCDRKVPVIFLENITNPKVTAALQEACAAQDWQVRIADQPLYSDALGVAAPTDTFLGAFMTNVELISKSLK